jgi:hypothetical protein
MYTVMQCVRYSASVESCVELEEPSPLYLDTDDGWHAERSTQTDTSEMMAVMKRDAPDK